MTTLQITGNTPEAMGFLEYARTLPFIREKRTKERAAELTPPCQYTTLEEFRAAVFEGMEAYRRGDVISQEDLEKEMLTW
jgi:hypothetical protein